MKAAPERVDEVVLLVVFPVPLDGGAVVEGREVLGTEVLGVEVPGVPEAEVEAEGVPEGALLGMETMGGGTVDIKDE